MVLPPPVNATVPALGRLRTPVVLTVACTVSEPPPGTSIAPAAPEIPRPALSCNGPVRVLFKVPPLSAIEFEGSPRLASEEIESVPPLIAILPVKSLAVEESTSVPSPVFVSPLMPEILALIVAVSVALTTRTSGVAPNVSVSPAIV